MMDRRLFVTLAALVSFAPALGRADPKKKGGGLSYIQLQPMTATILRANGRRGVLTVEIGLDLPGNPGLQARANLSQPRLRAAYLLALQAYASGLSPGAVPDADYIARQLQRETDKVLGQQGAKLLVGTILAN
jgi:hypothetical protein